MSAKLQFNKEKYEVKTMELAGETIEYRAFERISYVEHPVAENMQVLNIFVPEKFYAGESINGYNLKNAPIFMPNTAGGYMPGPCDEPGPGRESERNSIFEGLRHGYVVVSPGIRGREMKNAEGKFIGMAPAALCDYKAAVRYLRHNKENIPGDTEKIVSNGTSAGGAMSSLLGATGNHPDYVPYLKEMGAAQERDDIFAASCYCPITNLDHADMAYEWEFEGLNEYHKMHFEPAMEEGQPPKMSIIDGVMDETQQKMAVELKAMFPAYVNGLELKDENGKLLELDEQGEGSLVDYILQVVKASAQGQLDAGNDLSDLDWLHIENHQVTAIDFKKYVAFRTRMKDTPAFDSIHQMKHASDETSDGLQRRAEEMCHVSMTRASQQERQDILVTGTPENELFGTAEVQFRHFTEYSKERSEAEGELADDHQVKMMNPMNYIGDKDSTTAKHYRIRHGAVDRDTSLAISALLTAKLRNSGTDVDFAYPWGKPHSGDYDLDELFAWIDSICHETD